MILLTAVTFKVAPKSGSTTVLREYQRRKVSYCLNIILVYDIPMETVIPADNI